MGHTLKTWAHFDTCGNIKWYTGCSLPSTHPKLPYFVDTGVAASVPTPSCWIPGWQHQYPPQAAGYRGGSISTHPKLLDTGVAASVESSQGGHACKHKCIQCAFWLLLILLLLPLNAEAAVRCIHPASHLTSLAHPPTSRLPSLAHTHTPHAYPLWLTHAHLTPTLFGSHTPTSRLPSPDVIRA